jgi:hypothetical protein
MKNSVVKSVLETINLLLFAEDQPIEKRETYYRRAYSYWMNVRARIEDKIEESQVVEGDRK